MSDKQPIPRNIEEGVRFLMKELWPRVSFPQIIMYMVRDMDSQGSMQFPDDEEPAILRMDEGLLSVDMIDTYSTLAHELCHLLMWMKYNSKGMKINAHGAEWRAEMDNIGLPVPTEMTSKGVPTTRENVRRGGPFFVAYHKFLASKLLPEVSTNQVALYTGAAASTDQASRGRAWSLGGMFSRSSRQESAPTVAAAAPVRTGPKATPGGHHAVFGDCSGSMIDAGLFEIQRRAISALIAELGGTHTLFGYADNAVRFSTPAAMECDTGHRGYNKSGLESGTSFVACFAAAAALPGITHIHLFSDGYPENEASAAVMAERDRTTCNISTYYMQSPGFHSHHNPAVAAQLMASLARGAGSAHVVSGEAELMGAVRAEIGAGPMPFTVQPRQSRDWAPERQEALDHVKGIIKNQTHLVDLAGRTSDNTHRIADLEEDLKLAKFTNLALRQVVQSANETLDVIGAQFEADEDQRRITAEHNRCWIEGASGEIGRLSSQHFSQRLLSIAQDVSVAPQRTALPSVKLMSLNQQTINQATALMSGNASRAAALPPPGVKGAPAIAAPAPQGDSVGVGGARSVALWGQEKTPVRR
jgi:hypothetical protein